MSTTRIARLLIAALLSIAAVGREPVAAQAEEITIVQKDKSFSTARVNAKVGDTLVFVNDEADITHNVYSLSSGNEFELKRQSPGQVSRIYLDAARFKAGEMQVECAIHPRMKLTVKIDQ